MLLSKYLAKTWNLVGFGDEVVSMIQNVQGVEDARAEVVAGLPQITVRDNKDKLALYGLNVGDLNEIIRTGFAIAKKQASFMRVKSGLTSGTPCIKKTGKTLTT